MVGAAAWSHRWGVAAWSLAGAGFLLYFGLAYRAEVLSFAGGAAAFAAAAGPMAETMRALTGPADRLDTYGGYVTYHNVTIAALFLALWAVIQGARAVRGWEERGVVAVWLATGVQRRTLLVERWLGFLVALAVIAVAVGIGYGAGAAIAEEPDWAGSFAVAGQTALVAAGGFGLGLLAAQLVRTARTAAGAVAAGMVVVYVLGNMAPRLGVANGLRFLSPFFYLQQSRALIPGHHVDPVATAVLALVAALPVAAAAFAFERRDVSSALGARPERQSKRPSRPVHLRGILSRDAWLADVRAGAFGLMVWALASAGLVALIVSVVGQVEGDWSASEMMRALFSRFPGRTLADQYMAYVTAMAAMGPAGFVVSEAARWVGDLHEGRTATVVATTGSRSRAVLEWAATATVGVVTIAAGVAAGCLGGALVAGIGLRADGVLRMVADTALFGLAVVGVGLLAVAVFRSGFAVGALGAVLGAAFVISLFGPIFEWPQWLIHLSPFNAFGTPYLEVPAPGGLALMAGLALVGGAAAAIVARTRSTFA